MLMYSEALRATAFNPSPHQWHLGDGAWLNPTTYAVAGTRDLALSKVPSSAVWDPPISTLLEWAKILCWEKGGVALRIEGPTDPRRALPDPYRRLTWTISAQGLPRYGTVTGSSRLAESLLSWMEMMATLPSVPVSSPARGAEPALKQSFSPPG